MILGLITTLFVASFLVYLYLDARATKDFEQLTPGSHIQVKGDDGRYHIERVVVINDWNSYIVTERGNKYTPFDCLTRKIIIS